MDIEGVWYSILVLGSVSSKICVGENILHSPAWFDKMAKWLRYEEAPIHLLIQKISFWYFVAFFFFIKNILWRPNCLLSFAFHRSCTLAGQSVSFFCFVVQEFLFAVFLFFFSFPVGCRTQITMSLRQTPFWYDRHEVWRKCAA